MINIKKLFFHHIFYSVVLPLLVSSPNWAGPIDPTQTELKALERLKTEIPNARFIWRRGSSLYHATIKDMKPERVQTDSKTYNPRWSPDGKKIAFIQGSSTSGRAAYIMNADFTDTKKIASGISLANWTPEGDALTLVTADGYKVKKYTVANSKLETIYDAKESPYNGEKMGIGDAGYYAGEMRKGGRFMLNFIRSPHIIQIVDLQEKKYISSNDLQRGDCSPAWSPDGKFIIHTAKFSGKRPVYKSDFDETTLKLKKSERFCGLVTNRNYIINGQRLTWDGTWLIFYAWGSYNSGASTEVYCWKVGSDEEDIVRLTFDTGSDNQGDLYLFNGVSIKTPPVSIKGNLRIHADNANVRIQYSLEKSSRVSLQVYSLSGKLVSTLVNAHHNAGTYSVTFNSDKSSDTFIGNGIYLIHLSIEGRQVNKRVMLLR